MAATEKQILPGTSTSSLMYTDRRIFYPKPDSFARTYASVTPFTTTVRDFNTLPKLPDPQFKLFQHRPSWVRQYMQVKSDGGATTAADNAEDTLTLADEAYGTGLPSTYTNALLNLKCNVYASSTGTGVDGGKPTGASKGTVVITTFTSATSVNIKNLTGASITIAASDFLEVIGTAHGEGTVAAKPWADELQTVWGQAGIHKTSFQLTKTLMEASLRGASNEYDRIKAEKLKEHLIQAERDSLFSQNSIGTNLTQSGDTFTDGGRTDADGNVIRSTYGAFAALMDYGVTDTSDDDQNIFTFTTATDGYDKLVDITEKAFEYVDDGMPQPMYAGRPVLSAWAKIANKESWDIGLSDFKQGRLGFSFKELETPHGVYSLVPTQVITKSPYSGYGFAPSIEDTFMGVYRKMKYEQNIKTDDAPDYQKNQYMSDQGIGLTNLPKHKVIKFV